MEQVVLYLAVLAALAGFGMGLMNLAGPFLKRRNITLPQISSIAALLRRGRVADDEAEDAFDFDDDDDIETARDFAERSFAAETSLLARRGALDEEELDEELADVLDQVAVEAIATGEDGDAFEEDGHVIYTVPAEAHHGDDESLDDVDIEASGAEDDETDEEDEEDEESKPEVHVVAAGGGEDNMMSFFDESADDVAKAHLAWRDDLPEVSIADLLAEARAISQQIKGKKSNVA